MYTFNSILMIMLIVSKYSIYTHCRTFLLFQTIYPDIKTESPSGILHNYTE